MNKPLVYIDQNIINMQLQRIIDFSKFNEVYWVYSKEHFAEIKRSNDAVKYLKALKDIDAKLLELELDSEWKITGKAYLKYQGTPAEHYEAYLEAISDVDFNEHLYDVFFAWSNGGQYDELLKQLPNQTTENVLSLVKHFVDVDKNFIADIDKSEKKFEKMIDQMIQQGYDSWPIYLGIICCCTVLDKVGFQAEGKKSRMIETIPNVMNDAGHIAMGAFCSVIMSQDKRLINRAKAIYEYKDIKTSILHFEMTANKSMESIKDPHTTF